MKLLSPAKLNLFLHVFPKRPDGYHDIQTLFERIDLCDEIILTSRPSGIRLKCTSLGGADYTVPTGPKNLAYRAALLLKKKYGIQKGISIQIRKRIPVGAGLGGGSSNAATVLLGLNRFWKLGLSKKTLLLLGAELGSDVPFFILETAFATGEGRGEILKKIPTPHPRIWHCLVKPDFEIPTKAAYRRLDEKGAGLTPQKCDVRMLLHSIQKGCSEALVKLLTNSLELVLNKRVRAIQGIQEALKKEGALGALMSGSGSAVFGIYPSRQKAQKAARSLKQKNKNWQVFVASTW